MANILIFGNTVYASQEVKVIYNGNAITFQDQQPVVKDGRTLVPVSAIFNAFGMTVDWDSVTKTVTAKTTTLQSFLWWEATPHL